MKCKDQFQCDTKQFESAGLPWAGHSLASHTSSPIYTQLRNRWSRPRAPYSSLPAGCTFVEQLHVEFMCGTQPNVVFRPWG